MIIGLSGYAQSGKDTVAEILCLNYGFKRIAFADAIREALLRLNPMLPNGIRTAELVEDYDWDVAKADPEVRRLLQVLGTEVGRQILGDTAWTDIVMQHIDNSPHQNWVVTDVRFPNEANEIKSRSGFLIRVNRLNHSSVNNHKSERAMDNYMFDHVVYNEGTLDDLSEDVFMLMRSAFKL
jgi:hypothetical protein